MAVRARKPDGSKEAAQQVHTYISALDPSARRRLRALIAIVRSAAPEARLAFSYRIPAFSVNGRILVWCAGWKEHVSLYPVTKPMERAGGAALARFRHAKGTLRFSLDAELPAALVKRLVRARVAELTASGD